MDSCRKETLPLIITIINDSKERYTLNYNHAHNRNTKYVVIAIVTIILMITSPSACQENMEYERKLELAGSERPNVYVLV